MGIRVTWIPYSFWLIMLLLSVYNQIRAENKMRQGYRIDLTPDPWPRIDRKTRNMIRKGQRELWMRRGVLSDLKSLHWNTAYLPHQLNNREHVYVAMLDDSIPPISAVLVEEHCDHITYRYAGNNRVYSSYQGNSFLLWSIVEMYQGKQIEYVDLGGSAVPDIERFKRGFSTSTYELEKKPRALVLYRKLKYHIKKRLNT